jgi:hypothetical protein
VTQKTKRLTNTLRKMPEKERRYEKFGHFLRHRFRRCYIRERTDCDVPAGCLVVAGWKVPGI